VPNTPLKIIILCLWETPDTGCTFFLRPNLLFRARAGHSRDFGAASGGFESVTESKHEIVTESVESVTESKAEPIEDIRRIVGRWGELLKPHRDAAGQVKQPRWAKCWEMWQELARALNRSESPETGNGGEVS
jgi:hypothetical protein